MQKSYTAPFYSGIKENGLVIINSNVDLLSEEDHQRLDDLNVAVFNIDATTLAMEIGGTELSTNMAMIGACVGVTKVVTLDALDGALQDRFGKKYVASGGTATLDEAIKKKYAKKEMLLKKNMDTIIQAYKNAEAWSESNQPAMAGIGAI
jgi:pyruvate ferredoxin oxidoreductase gamma subunit